MATQFGGTISPRLQKKKKHKTIFIYTFMEEAKIYKEHQSCVLSNIPKFPVENLALKLIEMDEIVI